MTKKDFQAPGQKEIEVRLLQYTLRQRDCERYLFQRRKPTSKVDRPICDHLQDILARHILSIRLLLDTRSEAAKKVTHWW